MDGPLNTTRPAGGEHLGATPGKGESMDNEDRLMRRLLSETAAIAVIGASPDPFRDSRHVMGFLKARGYRVIPVNPRAAGTTILGEPVRASLADVAAEGVGPVELVDVFRNSAFAGEAVDQAIACKDALGIRGVWLQLGVGDDAAAGRAQAAGLAFVQNRCIMVEYARRFGHAARPSGGGAQGPGPA